MSMADRIHRATAFDSTLQLQMKRDLNHFYPEIQPPLSEPRSLLVFVDRAGIVHALSTDAEKERGRIPGHLLAGEYTVHEGVALYHPVQIGQPWQSA